jgi:hypothetical protein
MLSSAKGVEAMHALRSESSRLLRIATLVVTVANVGFNYSYVALGLGPSVKSVSDAYPSWFTPAPYAFGIWGVIYATMIAWSVASLTRSQRNERAYDSVAPAFLASNVLGAIWIVLFTNRSLWASVVVIALNLAVAGAALVRSHGARLPERKLLWFTLPGSLLFGWLWVATIACFAVALVARGFWGGALGAAGWTMLLLVSVGVVATNVAVRFRDFLVPAVASWACVAISVANFDGDRRVALVALGAGLAMVGVSAMTLWMRLRTTKRAGPGGTARSAL